MKTLMKDYIKEQIEKGNLLFLGDCSEIISILDSIKEEYLYPNDFHGLYHSQKVCFFAYLIGRAYGLNDEDLKILTDAAIYHDIGRRDDSEGDELHGYASALKIDKIIKYENPVNTYYLKAIMDAHSLNDSKIMEVYDNWRYEKNSDDESLGRKTENFDLERFMILSDILKDADALDRLRFSSGDVMLNESYLRCEFSKKLIKLSKEVNEYFYKKDTEQKYLVLKDENNQDTIDKAVCYHSVGLDFFKALSVLKYGILSHYNAAKSGINITRNFNGNNSEFWISVVDADEVKNNQAYERYVKNALSFYCYVNKLVPGVDRAQDIGSLEPRKSSEYDDEKFVFDKIPVECIQFLSIPKKYINTSIKELTYLYCNSQYETIKQSVENYLSEIEMYCDVRISRAPFERILKTIEDIQNDFNKKSRSEILATYNEYYDEIDSLKSELNELIQNSMQTGFSELMDRNFDENITLGEVVKYLLDTTQINYVPINDNLDEVDDEEEKFMNFPFYEVEGLYLIRLTTFDLNKNQEKNSETRSM